MKSKVVTLLILVLGAFGLGWWSSKMYHAEATNTNTNSLSDAIDQNNPELSEDEMDESTNTISANKADTIFNDDFELIVKDGDEQVTVWRKFLPKKTFSDFPAPMKFTDPPPKELNFSTCTFGKLYQPASRRAAAA